MPAPCWVSLWVCMGAACWDHHSSGWMLRASHAQCSGAMLLFPALAQRGGGQGGVDVVQQMAPEGCPMRRPDWVGPWLMPLWEEMELVTFTTTAVGLGTLRLCSGTRPGDGREKAEWGLYGPRPWPPERGSLAISVPPAPVPTWPFPVFLGVWGLCRGRGTSNLHKSGRASWVLSPLWWSGGSGESCQRGRDIHSNRCPNSYSELASFQALPEGLYGAV